MQYLMLFLFCFLGSSIQGATGFGFAIFTTPFLLMFLPIKTVTPVVLFMVLGTSLQVAFRLQKHINYKFMVYPAIGSIGGAAAGAYFFMNISADVLKTILGIILILLSAYFLFFNKRLRIKASIPNGLIFGTLSGITGAMFGMAGPAFVIYFFSSLKDKMEYNASIQAAFVLNSIYGILVHMFYGNITSDVITFSLTGAIAVIVGSMAGLRIFKRIKKAALSKVIYSFMVIMGVMMVVQ